MHELLITVPIVIFGGIIIWIMVFLGTFPHFPRMEKKDRIWFSIKNATIMAVLMMILLSIGMYLLIRILQ